MPRILIVEDENATAWALAESLQEDGHETSTVSSAEDALERLRRQPVDLVITDLRLPGMGGAQLARRLRGGRRPTPVIVVTAFGSHDVLQELSDYGVHAVFPKPFRVDQVRRSVRDAVGAAGPARVARAARESAA
jgi:two-component system, response regulator, stage 0 sporulation protein F